MMLNETCKRWTGTTEKKIPSVVPSPITPPPLAPTSSETEKDTSSGHWSDNAVCAAMLLTAAVLWDKIGSKVLFLKEKSWSMDNISTNLLWTLPWPDTGAPSIQSRFPEGSHKTTTSSKISSWIPTPKNISLPQCSSYLPTAILMISVHQTPNVVPWEVKQQSDHS